MYHLFFVILLKVRYICAYFKLQHSNYGESTNNLTVTRNILTYSRTDIWFATGPVNNLITGSCRFDYDSHLTFTLREAYKAILVDN